jgi:peptidoglycan/xylan/chitin deacetylase (PgdA/CDA1 family)
MVPCRAGTPIVSFTFDDFPSSSLSKGGAILKQYGCAGTYYTSLGLAGRTEPTGKLFELDDLRTVVETGHELGCHTYDHCDSWATYPADFEASVIRNRQALSDILPTAKFGSLSYPISYPRPGTKRRIARHFTCARGGGQTFNIGTMDANYLKAFFLEQSRDDFESVRRTIAENCQSKGWLIFATHDVSESPTRFGCKPDFFEKVVLCATLSGAMVLPVSPAWDRVQSDSAN